MRRNLASLIHLLYLQHASSHTSDSTARLKGGAGSVPCYDGDRPKIILFGVVSDAIDRRNRADA